MPLLRKVVVAMDSFKGSVSSETSGMCIAQSVKSLYPACQVEVLCVGDGGEGSGEILTKALSGEIIPTRAHDALMRPCSAFYGQLPKGRAIVEFANTCGLAQLAVHERNPRLTSSYGCGEVIKQAIDAGNKEIVLCLGGSATNDGGMGLLQALGFRFLDSKGRELPGCGDSLRDVSSIMEDDAVSMLAGVRFCILHDVMNPFYGADGAAYVYAPQKGATEEDVVLLDNGLQNFACVLEAYGGVDVQRIAGSGAAGGVAGGCISLLHADVESGIEYVLQSIDFHKHLSGCDLVITGEGRIDSQSFMGKVLQQIVYYSNREGVPVIAFAGQVSDDVCAHDYGLRGVYEIHPLGFPLELAMKKEHTLKHLSECVVRVLDSGEFF